MLSVGTAAGLLTGAKNVIVLTFFAPVGTRETTNLVRFPTMTYADPSVRKLLIQSKELPTFAIFLNKHE